MNQQHMELLAGEGWRDMVRDIIIPWALGGTDLGDDVLEVGPGPGMTTDTMRELVPKLTAVELDGHLAAALERRMTATNVDVVHADATSMPFDDDRFSSAVSFTMLHHVPTAELQDQLFAEVARVVRTGGLFVASDSVASDDLAALHDDDTYNPVDPGSVEDRLVAVGFSSVEVRANEFAWTARARVDSAAFH
jgi:ubiquinone/menaquinone biosynthesis C-methylase UbiE